MFKKINSDQIVLILSVISLIWTLLYKLLFISHLPIFKNAYDIGEITYNILNSVVASGIFYFFVVFLERKRKQKTVERIILKRLQSIRIGLFHIEKDTYPFFGLHFQDRVPDHEEFTKICKGIILDNLSPGFPSAMNTKMTWYQYFDCFFQSDQANINVLYEHYQFLDISLIEVLNELRYSEFQRALDQFREQKITNKLSATVGPFWMYLKSLEKISIYCNKLEKKYPELKIGSFEKYDDSKKKS